MLHWSTFQTRMNRYYDDQTENWKVCVYFKQVISIIIFFQIKWIILPFTVVFTCFQCDLCLKTCDRESDLVQHFSHCTGKPNYYPCNKCDMVCDSRASLRYHRRQHVVCVQYACRLIYLLKSKNFIFELISSHFSLLNRTKLQNRDEVLIVQKHIEGKNFDLRKFSFVYMMTCMTIILLLLQFQFFDLGT